VKPLVCLPQDLRSALQKLRSELQAKEASLKENETEKRTVIQEKDRSIAQLKCSLQDKEQQLQVIYTVPHTLHWYRSMQVYIHSFMHRLFFF